MARHKKQTVEYFPHDCDASDSKTLTIIQDQFGNDGYSFWFRLLERLGKSEGHCYNCNSPDAWQFLLAKAHMENDKALKVLDKLAELGAIDKELWGNKVIWCQNFVDRLVDVYDKRTIGMPHKPYFRPENTTSPSISGAEIPKVKESKLDQSKPNKSIESNNINSFNLSGNVATPPSRLLMVSPDPRLKEEREHLERLQQKDRQVWEDAVGRSATEEEIEWLKPQCRHFAIAVNKALAKGIEINVPNIEAVKKEVEDEERQQQRVIDEFVNYWGDFIGENLYEYPGDCNHAQRLAEEYPLSVLKDVLNEAGEDKALDMDLIESMLKSRCVGVR
jgi:hypothetical protein